MPLKRWKKLSQREIKRNDYWEYLLDEFEIEPGNKGEYHYVHTLGSTMIVPFTSEKKIILTNQYRYLLDKESLEFPCGSVHKELSFEDNAIKELREEAGYDSNELIFVGEFAPYNGVGDEICKVYVAHKLLHSPLPIDETEEFEILEYSFDEIEKLISENKIWDGMTIAAWTLAKPKIMELL
ncbi:MAG: NUDIX hydrolase [Melioribacteraceae bacterium]|nr:NUDIX hydrolase [Melioribacteraceae bacterium]MCF8355450.1 NUDIX hydrolase [Melioribacteraceae bacterium]MCF8395385.1 NUDIX hydrolase [Melioribacteraceae bacterium]MCF8420478.1 NUDIX hydrolase [Melioribacteraceae bacterium]